MSNSTTLAKGGVLNLFGSIFFQLLNFLFIVLITRTSGEKETGLFVLALTVVTILGTLSLMGLDKGIIRFINLNSSNNPDSAYVVNITKFSLFLIASLGTVLAVMLMLSSEWLATEIFRKPAVQDLLFIMSISIPLYGLIIAANSVSQSFKIMKHTVWTNQIFKPVSLLLLTVITLNFSNQLIDLSIAYVFSLFLTFLLALFFLNQFILLHKTDTSKINKKDILKFSIPSSLSSLLTYAMVQTEVLILGILSSPEDIAIYYIAWRTAAFGVVFHGALAGIFSPYVASLLLIDKKAELEKLYQLAARWSVTISLPILIILALYSKQIMLLFNVSSNDAEVVLIIISLGLVANIIVGPATVALVMSGHSKLELYNNISLLILKTFLAFMLIPLFGIIGAAISSIVVSASINLLRVYQLKHLLNISPFSKGLLKPFVATFIAFCIVLLFKYISPIQEGVLSGSLQLLTFSVSYLLMMLLLKLEKEDIELKNKILIKIGL